MENFDLTKYLDMIIKRKWWIIIPFLLALLGGLFYGLVTPKIYQANTMILVQPPRVSEDLVQPIVSTTVEDRLRTIEQQVRSRTNLEKIIQKDKSDFEFLRDNCLETAKRFDMKEFKKKFDAVIEEISKI